MLIAAIQEKLLELCGVDVPHGMLIRCTNCNWKGILDSLFLGRKCEHCEQETLVEEREYLLSQMKPIKVGGDFVWADDTGGVPSALITHDIPRTPYLFIYRVEAYMVNFTAGAMDYGLTEPVPQGTAYWQQGPYGASTAGTSASPVTDQTAPSWAICDVDEFLIIQGGQNVQLVFTPGSNGPTDEERIVRGLMYGLYLGSAVIESLMANQSAVMNIPSISIP